MSIPAINANIVEEKRQIAIFLARVAERGNLRNPDNSDGIRVHLLATQET